MINIFISFSLNEHSILNYKNCDDIKTKLLKIAFYKQFKIICSQADNNTAV